MSYINLFEKLHGASLKLRNVSLIVFFLTLLISISTSNNAFGESVVGTVQTKISVNFDGQTKSFTATQNTIEGALSQGGIYLSKNDITRPEKDTLINGKETIIEVIRQVPVLISDEKQQRIEFSAFSDQNEIVKQLNIELYPEDRIYSELILDPVDERSAGQKVTIDRAPTYTVSVDDEDKIIRSWGKTVKEVLEGNIALGQKDIIEPALDEVVTDGKILITRVNEVETEETVSIPFETVTQNDYSLFQGQTKVIQEGVSGQKKQQLKITYHNGVETNRVVLHSEVVSTPTTKKIIKGLKPYNAGAWWDTLVAAGSKYGVNPVDMYNVMNCESKGNPYAGTYYKGLFQYSPETWAGASAAAGYGGASITDGNAQIYVTAWKVSREGWRAWGCKP